MKVTRERWLLELRRKGTHLATGFIPLAYALWLDKWTAVILLAIMLAVVILIEHQKRCESRLGGFFNWCLKGVMREDEVSGKRLLGATPYTIASLVAVLLLPKPIAVLAMLYLAIGDTAASLIGLGWGRHKVGRKSWEGFAAFSVSCALVAIVAHLCSSEYPLFPALIAAPCAALAELLLPQWDDNWTVPLAASLPMLALHALRI